jgi:hypothetical protein
MAVLATPPPAQAGALARASYNILSRYVGSRLCKPTVCARPGGHRRQMEARSCVSCLRLGMHIVTQYQWDGGV